MRKIFWLQMLAFTVSLPSVAQDVVQEGAPTVITPTVIAPNVITPTAITPESPAVPVVTPRTPFPTAVTSPVAPAAVTPPIQTVPALPVPAIPTQPASPPYIPFSSSYIPTGPGSSTYYNPYGPGPGLPPSPLDARFNAPLGLPWKAPAVPVLPAGPIIVPGYAPGHRNVPLAPIPIPPHARLLAPGGHFADPTYLFPGLVTFTDNHWIGSDYLFNVPHSIGVAVELIVPSEFSAAYHKEGIREEIEGIFSTYGINPFSEVFGDAPPLPFFHLVVFAIPVKNSYVVNVVGRLFEEVKLPRLNYKLPGTWQAITWEKQELVVSSRGHVLERLNMTIKEIATLFASRVNHFNRRFLEHQDELSVQGPEIGSLASPFLHEHSPCCDD